MVTILHFETLQVSRTPRGVTRARRDGGLRYTLLRELKVTTVTHLEHLGAPRTPRGSHRGRDATEA